MKGKAFCPICGKTDEELFSGLCRSCFIEELNLITVPNEIQLTTCTNADQFKKGRWCDSDLIIEEQSAEAILEHVEVNEIVSNAQIVPEIKNIRGSIS